MDVFFWAIDPRVAFWTRFEANFRLGGNQGPLFLNGLASPRVPGQLRKDVTAQVPPERSGNAESADQRLRVLDQSVNDVPALLPGGRDEGADHGEVARPFLRPEAAGDFLPDLHHAPVALGLIVGCALERCTRSPGAIPGRQTLAPAGSTWSGPGGNKWSEAL